MSTMKKSINFGPLLVIGSALLYGIMPTLMKITYAYGGNGILSTFYTCLFALPFLWLWARREQVSLLPQRSILKKLCILSLGTCPTSIMLYMSYSYLPVGMATTLHFIYPSAAALYLFLFWHQRMTFRKLSALALALGGVFALGAGQLGKGSLVGILLAVSSGMTWAFYIVYMDKSGLKELPPCQLNFYMALANLVVSAVVAVLTGNFAIYSAAFVWPVVIITAILLRIVANSLFQTGIARTDAFSASIFSTFEPLTSLLVGILFLGEQLTAFQAVGTFLILGAILINITPESAS